MNKNRAIRPHEVCEIEEERWKMKWNGLCRYYSNLYQWSSFHSTKKKTRKLCATVVLVLESTYFKFQQKGKILSQSAWCVRVLEENGRIAVRASPSTHTQIYWMLLTRSSFRLPSFDFMSRYLPTNTTRYHAQHQLCVRVYTWTVLYFSLYDWITSREFYATH